MGQIIPVDRFARATDIGRCGNPHAMPDAALAFSIGSSTLFLRLESLPARALNYLREAFSQRATGDAQTINRTTIGLNKIMLAQSHRIEAQIMGDLIEMHLDCVARLRSAVPAFGTTGRLIGKEAHTL